MSKVLPSEYLSLKYDAPHQRGMTIDEEDNERERISYERCVDYFESSHDDYIRQ